MELKTVDVLCVGQASYDLIFSIPHHPEADEKIFADDFLGFGGGPAANAAVMAARLGFKSAFSGFLSDDLFGEKHHQELVDEGVCCRFAARGPNPTPVSTVLVKPDGQRALINYKKGTEALPKGSIDFSAIKPKVILFDGHEPYLSLQWLDRLKQEEIISVLDAGSLHFGTSQLMDKVDYLACSEKFAKQYAGDEQSALVRLAEISPNVIITLGERGLIWRRAGETGSIPAYPVKAVDTTGAGDAFHGALAAAVASGMDWIDSLYYAGAAGSLCCTQLGARPGLASLETHRALFSECRSMA